MRLALNRGTWIVGSALAGPSPAIDAAPIRPAPSGAHWSGTAHLAPADAFSPVGGDREGGVATLWPCPIGWRLCGDRVGLLRRIPNPFRPSFCFSSRFGGTLRIFKLFRHIRAAHTENILNFLKLYFVNQSINIGGGDTTGHKRRPGPLLDLFFLIFRSHHTQARCRPVPSSPCWR